MDASVIIPTLNRALLLEKTLHSIAQLNTDKTGFEVLVVDNGSSDQTSAIVQEVRRLNPSLNLRYFYDDIPGLLTGRHRGAMEANGHLLCFIDDDVELSTDWLNALLHSFSAYPDINFVTGPNLPKYETYPPSWLSHFFESTAYGGQACGWLSLLDLGHREIRIHPNYVWGLNFAVRKKNFFELKGFHPDNIPSRLQRFQGDGETGLTIKAVNKGYEALYQPGALLYHQIPKERLTKEYFGKRAFYQGVAESYTRLRRSKEDSIPLENNLKNKPPKVLGFLKKLNRKMKKGVKGTQNTTIVREDILEIIEHTNAQYKAGYEFHQNAYQDSSVIQAWAHQDSYLNYTLPNHD